MKNVFFLLTAILTASLNWSYAQGATIHLSGAASMTDAIKEMVSRYQVKHPKTKILLNFASSGTLAKQIALGAPADLYISANAKWMDFLEEKEMITASSRMNLAFNRLVFIGPQHSKITTLEQIASLDKIALGTPQNVPAGQYARQAMVNAGIYATLERDRKLILAKDVRQALLYADKGMVDGSFVYTTDGRLARNTRVLFSVPQELYSSISYPVALTPNGSNNTEAVSFFSFLTQKQVIDILIRYGFEPAQ